MATASTPRIDPQEARELLLQKRMMLLSRLDTQIHAERSPTSPQKERTVPGDAADSAVLSEEEDKTLSQAQRTNDAVKQVELALERVGDGTYGICVDCREPIDPQRLRSQPEAVRCLSDQEEFDRRQSGGTPHHARL